ncbi:hypothetical protein [Leucobacter ruminantium]|uniref:YCII-related domain-containing protein n=1 Tax=Leucobacter ruminantium TaxID=1289170 RepID=A0A939M1L5_9MICO|nr:hypothetical protein [Leucobacter ruminantium]MBO1805380.1 hypothetical protein [Leucobacter ruminantium]
MRYMLLAHGLESALIERGPVWVEEVVSFLARFEDELAGNSELEWTEALDGDEHAVVVGPGGETREGWYNREGEPLRRLWVVRVPDRDRARELAGLLAGELDTWVEVRECLPTAQRP